MNDLARQIEDFLLSRGGWVPARDICLAFGVQERDLRATGQRPGLCGEFAISGNQGFRHVATATDPEFADAYRRMRRHGLSELVHARRLKAARARRVVTSSRPPITYERHSGQALLPCLH